MKPTHVFPGLHRAVLRHVLRERHHQALALVQHVNLLTLRFSETERVPHHHTRGQGTQPGEDQQEKPDLPEARFYIP